MILKNFWKKSVLCILICSVCVVGYADCLDCDTGVVSSSSRGSGRLKIGGYGEAVMTRNYFSDHIYRYTNAAAHANDDSHGRFDIPRVALNLGYDLGKGWSLGMEVEYEHGGSGGAVELDADESGEYEAETEKGGEVALEQFWIEKSFGRLFKVRVGEIVVPVGLTNKNHEPVEFFSCYRPEGEEALFPCTWHQMGLSLGGMVGDFHYEALFLPALTSERFGSNCFVHYGATSCYEFQIANNYAVAARIDNYSVKGLRVGLSGYYGETFKNTLRTIGSRYENVRGALAIGSVDFEYNDYGIVARGYADYAHLGDADLITAFNKNYPLHSAQDGSPSKHQPVASNALAIGVEAGYDVMRFLNKSTSEKLYVFGRYEYYDAMASSTYRSAYEWCKTNRMAVGLNYFPMSDVVVKAEYSKRFLKSQFNNEPSVSVAIAWSGLLMK